MTRIEFLEKYGEEVKRFVTSEAGIAYLNLVSSVKPIYEFSPVSHIFAENRGAQRGYELCIRNFISLSVLPKITEEIEADYGVPNNSQPTE